MKIELLSKVVLGEGKNKLNKWVWDDVCDRIPDYAESARMADIIRGAIQYGEAVSTHGCHSGIVTSLIYREDTSQFFNNFKSEIIEKLDEVDFFDYSQDTLKEYLFSPETVENKYSWIAYEIIISEILGILYEKFQEKL